MGERDRLSESLGFTPFDWSIPPIVKDSYDSVVRQFVSSGGRAVELVKHFCATDPKHFRDSSLKRPDGSFPGTPSLAQNLGLRPHFHPGLHLRNFGGSSASRYIEFPMQRRRSGGQYPMGEIQNQPFQLPFTASLKIDFQGSRVISELSAAGRRRPDSGAGVG